MVAATTSPPAKQTQRVTWQGETWVVIPRVPIFRTHKLTRYVPDGKGGRKAIVLSASRADLVQCAATAAERERRTGDVLFGFIGHRKQDPAFPEHLQPKPICLWRNISVAPYDDEQGLFADLYVRPEHYDEVLTYPYRSAEYYPPHGRDPAEIGAVALLRRDSELDLGPLAYGRGANGLATITGQVGALAYGRSAQEFANRPCYSYAMERDMSPNPPGGMPADPTAPPDAAAAMEPSHGEKMEQYMKHCFSHPYAKHFAMHYAAGGEGGMGGMGAPGAGAPSPTDGFMPGAEEPEPKAPSPEAGEEEKKDYQTRRKAWLYQRELITANRRIQALERQRADDYRSNLITAYQRSLERLRDAQGYQLDISRELMKLERVPTNDLPKVIQENTETIEVHYQRAPIGNMPFIQPANNNQTGAPTQDQYRAAVSLAAKKGIDFSAALAEVRK